MAARRDRHDDNESCGCDEAKQGDSGAAAVSGQVTPGDPPQSPRGDGRAHHPAGIISGACAGERGDRFVGNGSISFHLLLCIELVPHFDSLG